MARKENKGGFLSNVQVEQDLKAKGKDNSEGHLEGAQDTGEKSIRSMGTQVQKEDGMGERNEKDANS